MPTAHTTDIANFVTPSSNGQNLLYCFFCLFFLFVCFFFRILHFNPCSDETGILLEKMVNAMAVSHYNDVIMSAMASQITCLTIVYSTVYSGADQRKHQSSSSLAFMLGIHRSPVNSPHKGPVTGKMLPFHDVIMLPCLRASPCY